MPAISEAKLKELETLLTTDGVVNSIKEVIEQIDSIPPPPPPPIEETEEVWRTVSVPKDIFNQSEWWQRAVEKGHAQIVGEAVEEIIDEETEDDQLYPTLVGERPIKVRGIVKVYLVKVREVKLLNKHEFDEWEKALQEWAESLPPTHLLGLISIFHDMWGDGVGWGYIGEEWINSLKFSLRYKYRSAGVICEQTYNSLKNPQEREEILEHINTRLKYHVTYIEPDYSIFAPLCEEGLLFYPSLGKLIYDTTLYTQEQAVEIAKELLIQKKREKGLT